MLPVLLEALRISMIFNLTGVILAEMYASRDGIGHQIATGAKISRCGNCWPAW